MQNAARVTRIGTPRQYAVEALIGVALAAAYLAVHPSSFFADAVWYARDLARHVGQCAPLLVDAGHLIWRPLGLLTWRALLALAPGVDALIALQLLAAAGTAMACLGSYHLARRFGLANSVALSAAAIVMGSQVCLAYGAGGSSYTSAMAALVYAALPLVRPSGEWSIRHACASAVAFALACGFWLVSVLVLPALFTAAVLYSSGQPMRRILRGAGASALATGAAGALVVASYAISVTPQTPGFFTWLRASDHGIEAGVSTVGVARAVYGFTRAFLDFGSLGTSIKGVMLDDAGLVRPEQLVVPVIVGIPFVILLALSIAGLVRAIRTAPHPGLTVAAVAAAAVAPVAGFAALWQGSDIERFSGALPFAAIAIAAGLCAWRSHTARLRPEWLMVLIVLVGNSATVVAPALVPGGDLPMELARTADRSLPPRSLLVITGGDLGAGVWAPAAYFSDVEILSLDFDARRNGADAWDDRLGSAIDRAASAGGGVAVLSDLIGEPTLGGIGLSVTEHPRPSLHEVASYFSEWEKRERWTVGRFTFVNLEPPARLTP